MAIYTLSIVRICLYMRYPQRDAYKSTAFISWFFEAVIWDFIAVEPQFFLQVFLSSTLLRSQEELSQLKIVSSLRWLQPLIRLVCVRASLGGWMGGFYPLFLLAILVERFFVNLKIPLRVPQIHLSVLYGP